jgi:hypothetical protein
LLISKTQWLTNELNGGRQLKEGDAGWAKWSLGVGFGARSVLWLFGCSIHRGSCSDSMNYNGFFVLKILEPSFV